MYLIRKSSLTIAAILLSAQGCAFRPSSAPATPKPLPAESKEQTKPNSNLSDSPDQTPTPASSPEPTPILTPSAGHPIQPKIAFPKAKVSLNYGQSAGHFLIEKLEAEYLESNKAFSAASPLLVPKTAVTANDKMIEIEISIPEEAHPIRIENISLHIGERATIIWEQEIPLSTSPDAQPRLTPPSPEDPFRHFTISIDRQLFLRTLQQFSGNLSSEDVKDLPTVQITATTATEALQISFPVRNDFPEIEVQLSPLAENDFKLFKLDANTSVSQSMELHLKNLTASTIQGSLSSHLAGEIINQYKTAQYFQGNCKMEEKNESWVNKTTGEIWIGSATEPHSSLAKRITEDPDTPVQFEIPGNGEMQIPLFIVTHASMKQSFKSRSCQILEPQNLMTSCREGDCSATLCCVKERMPNDELQRLLLQDGIKPIFPGDLCLRKMHFYSYSQWICPSDPKLNCFAHPESIWNTDNVSRVCIERFQVPINPVPYQNRIEQVGTRVQIFPSLKTGKMGFKADLAFDPIKLKTFGTPQMALEFGPIENINTLPSGDIPEACK
jgi:hypothetical protein